MPSLYQRVRIKTRRANNPNAKYVVRIQTVNHTVTENGLVTKNTSTTTREIVPNVDSKEN